MIGKIAQQEIDNKAEALKALALKIWETPEIAWEEKNAALWTGDILEAAGFAVERAYTGIPTAIKASFGSGKPVIALLGEYDALPGMSQKVSTTKEAAIDHGPGQGCGHNLLGTAHVAAAIGIQKEMIEKKLPGTIIFYGCPAEEILIGKPFMARNGAFADIDMSIAWHPSVFNQVNLGSHTALNNVKFHFKGITAHAGGDPHNGRSALDAAEIMNVGANFLREHVTDDVRIHYVLTESGEAPNIVPDKATNWYYVRALTRDGVESTYKRLLKIAEGAALMTETSVEVEYLGGCYNTLNNKVLANHLHQVMSDTPPPTWSPADISFAKALNEKSANYERMLASGKIKEEVEISTDILPMEHINSYGSTDVGDVQHMAPGIFFTTATYNIGAGGHSWQNTACSGHEIGLKGMLYAGKIMAKAAMEIFNNKDILEKAQEEFKTTMGKESYICPIPKDLPFPGK